MSLDVPEKSLALDYQLCSYDGCRLNFRGPETSLSDPYVAVLGGTEVFGRFVEHPFPSLLQEWIGTSVANLGVAQAGLSLFSEEPWLMDAGSRSDVTVLQVLGAQNMSNRLYSVHSRRNDRFLAVSPALRDMYPKVDFSEINFTGHLLETLSQDEVAFAKLVDELKWAWLQRMRRVLAMIQGEVILLWLSHRSPDDVCCTHNGIEPLFVDRAMLTELSDQATSLVEVIIDNDRPKLGEMIVAKGEADAALCLPGPQDHMRAAEALATEIARITGADPGKNRVRA